MLERSPERTGNAPTEGPARPRIVFVCDEAFAMPLATVLRSLVEANPDLWPLDLHVLTDDLSEGTQQKVRDSLPEGAATIRFVTVDVKPFGGFTIPRHISVITYARLLIPTVFPPEVTKVLYLDADTLVLDHLGPLWETDLEGAVVGAVLDGVDAALKSNKPGLEEVPRVQDYFNSGVMLIDLERWRKEQISEKALEYLVRQPRSRFLDQCALNLACDGLWKRLDGRWNHQQLYQGQKLAELSPEERPGIVHFVWKHKPWIFRRRDPNAAFYDEIRSRTRFARSPTERFRDSLRSRASASLEAVRRQPFSLALRRLARRFRR